jgi:hypothetical protein
LLVKALKNECGERQDGLPEKGLAAADLPRKAFSVIKELCVCDN